jgi:hypothetical protein
VDLDAMAFAALLDLGGNHSYLTQLLTPFYQRRQLGCPNAVVICY